MKAIMICVALVAALPPRAKFVIPNAGERVHLYGKGRCDVSVATGTSLAVNARLGSRRKTKRAYAVDVPRSAVVQYYIEGKPVPAVDPRLSQITGSKLLSGWVLASSVTRSNTATPAADRNDSSTLTAFKRWALHQAVVSIEFRYMPDNFFVELKPYKLTSKANVQSIAEFMARAYCNQCDRPRAVCHIMYKGSYVRGIYLKD